MSLSISYDSSFDGFLSVVFEIYRQHLDVGEIRSDRSTAPCNLFMQPFRVETSAESAQRLRRAIVNQASAEILELLRVVLCSEEDGVEMKILAYLRKVFDGKDPHYAKNPTSDEMLPLYMIARAVRREEGGMLGMLRFDRTADGTYFAEIEPKYNILGMMVGHFRGRFANERWAIYDSKRGFGVYYNGQDPAQGPVEITIPNMQQVKAATPKDDFVKLWQDYYKSIAIKERENPRLLRSCLPVRYWNHLPERQIAPSWT
ncbi:TIGR03915 family putative DNA repair protein [Fibrobacter sp.]|uniref:TIGR03915 family putative DNA repair protein n=1 Tax=Fibrobacter sp. TaxID=35828 RepID=UPI00388EED7E